MRLRLCLCLVSAAILCPATSIAAPADPQVTKRIPLDDGGWDLLAVDSAAHRVLIARSDGVDSVDTRTGTVTPHLISGQRFHGIAMIPGTSLALATQAAGSATVFDAVTGKIIGAVKTDDDADATIYEPSSRTIWVMNGDSGTIAIVGPSIPKVASAITVGGSLEMAALDGRGHLFVNVADKGELAEIDIAKRTVTRRVPLAGCQHPTGLAYLRSGILLSACANVVAKLTRASDLKGVGEIAIGPRPDGAFADATRHRAYVPSGGDGTLTVIDTGGALPRKIATVQTQVGARTGAVDPVTGTVYLPAARYGPAAAAGARPAMIPGSVQLLVIP